MPRLPRPRLLLALIAVVSLFGGIAGVVAVSWFDHDATLTDITNGLTLSTRLMETHLRGLQSIAELQVTRIDERIGASPPSRLAGSDTDRAWLAGLLAEIPGALALTIHDSGGAAILTATRHGLTDADGGDTDVVAQALARPGTTVMGAPAAGSRTTRAGIILCRALRDQSGSSRGVASLLIDPDYFAEFYRPLQPPDIGSVFAIFRMDGRLVVRYPMPPDPVPRLDPTKRPFATEFAGRDEGVYRAVSVVDGVERLVSFRRLTDLDVVLASSTTTAMAFRDWTRRTQRNATLFAGTMLLLLGLAAMTSESMRHKGALLRSVEQKAAELATALAEKDVLFQEVHHRVKNNLQVISSLLTMQSLQVVDDSARGTLRDALDRIHSMGLVHQTLYERNLAANVDLGAYFGRLAEGLARSYGNGGVTVEVKADGTLDLERAVPLGMLANEALSNALKHAFADGRTGTVRVSLERRGDEWRFAVQDDGIGMPEASGRGIGVNLMVALAHQLNGSATFSTEGGTVVAVTFPA